LLKFFFFFFSNLLSSPITSNNQRSLSEAVACRFSTLKRRTGTLTLDQSFREHHIELHFAYPSWLSPLPASFSAPPLCLPLPKRRTAPKFSVSAILRLSPPAHLTRLAPPSGTYEAGPHRTPARA
ncbi:hypothetical protein BC937DRAFT_89972, partial [Endogone sp. FLAS-F59071]